MPAAIDLLSIVTLADGLRASPEMAVVARLPQIKTKRTSKPFEPYTYDFLLDVMDFAETIYKRIELVYWTLVQYEK